MSLEPVPKIGQAQHGRRRDFSSGPGTRGAAEGDAREKGADASRVVHRPGVRPRWTALFAQALGVGVAAVSGDASGGADARGGGGGGGDADAVAQVAAGTRDLAQ